ncbi:hypothetical protein PC116_g19537 [Phytophthora cactorum]|uniref:Uncharacterized protein n=1 Tax=Phytophthora cactorum TaxID=29920 RepID=A0A8T1K979_9STRA|nr:hypothetical protein Pcac1_g15235 [Phytophthora cactorum]KAG2891412.1 hypothetical protein PC114_g17008 [Phytophthora cactorum]KAG2921560.1 hypothetical protein PC117_g16192 [Phytophthora cactorum]KAG3002152.1 hypothetical protein PC119_g16441 [Phytophthora cactorum]KAG3008986.1 hypothetical protein PC120_g15897 [Phytophthora cactorum]
MGFQSEQHAVGLDQLYVTRRRLVRGTVFVPVALQLCWQRISRHHRRQSWSMTQAFASAAIGGSLTQGEFRDSNQLVASSWSDSRQRRLNMRRGIKFLSSARQSGDLEDTAEMQADVPTGSSAASVCTSVFDASTRVLKFALRTKLGTATE